MNNRRIIKMSMATLALLMSCSFSFAQTENNVAPAEGSVVQTAEILVDSSLIEQAMDVLGEKYSESAIAQEEITRLANAASSSYEEFKRSNDALEGLLVYNATFRKQIANQLDQIATLDESIASVEQVTQQIPLLMEKMLSSIEQFIELDYPFRTEERANRIQFARDAIDNPDVSIAEKFRQVLVMYQIESSAGRTYETYPDTITLSGAPRDVIITRIGRIALMYQTTDRQQTGAWDNNTRAWVELPAGEYRTAFQFATRVVSSLEAPDIIQVPVLAPESVQ
jgi:hypothetical protein